MLRRASILAVCLTVGCASGSSLGEDEPSSHVPDPAAVPEGYTRFVMTPRELGPGEEVIVNEWIAPAQDVDVDIADIHDDTLTNLHHLVVYSSIIDAAVGSIRVAQYDDQLALDLRFLGGFGKEAQNAFHLPQGVVFRVNAGRALLANLHYLNTSSEKVLARAWVDLKLVEASPTAKTAALLAVSDIGLSLPPHAASSLDVACTMDEDVGLIGWANHMHELGTAARSDVLRQDGTVEGLRDDDTWQPEWALDSQYTRWPLEAPLPVRKGDTLRTHCEWQNPGADKVTFPREMCLGFAFFVGQKDLLCSSGKWL